MSASRRSASLVGRGARRRRGGVARRRRRRQRATPTRERHDRDEEGDRRHQVGGEAEARPLGHGQDLGAVLGDQRVLDLRPCSCPRRSSRRRRPSRAAPGASRRARAGCRRSGTSPRLRRRRCSTAWGGAAAPSRRRRQPGRAATRAGGLIRDPSIERVDVLRRKRSSTGPRQISASLPLRVDEEVLRHPGRAEGFAALVADRAQLRVGGAGTRRGRRGRRSLLSWTLMPSTVTPSSRCGAPEALQLRRLVAAGRAPGGPEVDQDPFAAVVGDRALARRRRAPAAPGREPGRRPRSSPRPC